MYDEYVQKVYKIAQVKYELSEDVMEAFSEEIELCYENNFSPIRTVEYVASKLF